MARPHLPGADPLLAEAEASGLALERVPASPAKIRLLLDLVAEIGDAPRARILDVGCGGRKDPFNLWEPLLPLAGRIELVGVDVDFLEETRARAEAVGFPVELHRAGAFELARLFGERAFDAVVSTQVLEHIPDWRRALAEMAAVTRPGGALLVTCDAGDTVRTPAERARLAGKRAFARLAARLPAARRIAGARFSGEWEAAPTPEALRDAAAALGLDVERLTRYGLRDLKTVTHETSPATRLLAAAVEESLLRDGVPERQPALYRVLYLRARRRLAPGGAFARGS